MPRPWLRLALLCLAVGAARPAAAQTVVWTDAPLADVLYGLADRTGLDLVFAARVVRDIRVTARYTTGEPPVAALQRILRGTGVRAEPLRPGQFVLIAAPLNVTLGGDETPAAVLGALEGVAVDAETGETLPGASVLLVDVGIGTVADLEGAFVIRNLPAGRYAVRVTYIGYRPARLDLDVFPDSPRRPPVVRLSPEPPELTEVKIDASPPGSEGAPGMTDVRARGVAAAASPAGRGDLAAALGALPGLTRAGGASGRLSVRGADPDALRVLRDGVPVFEPWHAAGLVLTLQPEALGRIVLHRGLAPAPIGGGLSAVLETETASALAGDSATTVALSPVAVRGVGNVALSPRVALHLDGQRSVLGVLMGPGVRRVGSVWAVDPLGGRGGEVLRPRVSFESAGAALAVRFGRATRLDVAVWGARDRLTVDAAAPALAARSQSRTATARLRGLVGDRTFVSALVYRTSLRDALDWAAPPAEAALAESAAGLDVDRALGVAHTLSVGARGLSRQADGDRAVPALDAFVADAWSPSRSLGVQAGLRVEAARGTAALVSPRVYVRWTPVADRLILRAGVARQGQAVQRLVRRAGALPLAGARWAVAGDGVAPASAWQAGAGLEWAPTDRLALSVDAYGRLDRNVLRETPGGGFAPNRGRALGVDVAARASAGVWTVSLAGAAAHADVRETSGAWRAAPFSRPLSAGVLVERPVGPLAFGLRLDAASGLPDGSGRRLPADIRTGAALGMAAVRYGVRFDALVQATVRLAGAPGGDPVDAALALPLAQDARALPAWPTLSVSARW